MSTEDIKRIDALHDILDDLAGAAYALDALAGRNLEDCYALRMVENVVEDAFGRLYEMVDGMEQALPAIAGEGESQESMPITS